MRLSDIVNQLQLVLPNSTDYFSVSLDIDDITVTNPFEVQSDLIRNWFHITVNSNTGDVWAVVFGADIYKQTGGTGAFVAQGAPNLNWTGIAVNPNTGDVWACVLGGNIYMNEGGTGSFATQGEPNRQWRGVAVNRNTGDVWIGEVNGDIYKNTGGAGSFIAQGVESRNWSGISVNSNNGDVWASALNDDIYLNARGTGSFIAQGAGNRVWRAIAVNSENGDVWAAVQDSNIYRNIGGVGPFIIQSALISSWRGISVNSSTGDVWITAFGGNIYRRSSNAIATINTTTNHNLLANAAVTISRVGQQLPISGVSQDGLVFTFTTSRNHDLTAGYPGYETVLLGGFTDSNWNGSFTLLDTPNRRSFRIQSTNSLPTLNGNEYLHEVRIDGINGRHQATIVDPNTFTITGDFLNGDYIGGTIKTAVRIAGSVTIERALQQYTEQQINDLWMFVVMNDAEISKDRNAYNDTIASLVNGEDVRLRLIDGFSIFIVKNITDEQAAVNAMDIARHDLLGPILKSIYGARFPTGLTGEADFVAIPTGHNFVAYNRATFVYQYSFEITSDLIADDSVEFTDNKAFAEIDYTHDLPDNTTDPIVNVELDQ